MHKISFFLFFIFYFFMSPLVSAHIGGVSIMKINGTNTKMYPSQVNTSVLDIPAEADIASKPYIKGEKLEFLIDTTNFPVPQEVIRNTNFTWNFGDGTKNKKGKSLLKINHIYKKAGTHTVKVIADYASAGYPDLGEQPVQVTILHILPHKTYQLPKVKIFINEVESFEKKTVAIDLNKWVTLRVVPQTQQASVLSYEWDLGDGTTSTSESISHRYRLPQYSVTPVVRVKDQNGFFIDTFVSLRNSGKNDPNNPEMEEFLWNSIKVSVVLFIISLGLITFVKRPRAT